jgi:uncharacterized protein (DUF302 family)
MKRIIAAAAFACLTAGSAYAVNDDVIRVKAVGDVPSTMDALVAAVEEAGATVFARVDHAGGAQSVDMELTPSELLIFGNPKLGTPAMQDNALAGLFLPLRVLVYRDEAGQVWLAYEDPHDMLDGLGGIPADAKYVQVMSGALNKLTGKAARN